jgi:hypothetical protein
VTGVQDVSSIASAQINRRVIDSMDRKKALEFSYALTSLPDSWNDAGEDEDCGMPNNGLCLIIFVDGSGKLGIYRPVCGNQHKDRIIDLNYSDVMNIQHEFNNVEELAEYLAEWCDETEP